MILRLKTPLVVPVNGPIPNLLRAGLETMNSTQEESKDRTYSKPTYFSTRLNTTNQAVSFLSSPARTSSSPDLILCVFRTTILPLP